VVEAVDRFIHPGRWLSLVSRQVGDTYASYPSSRSLLFCIKRISFSVNSINKPVYVVVISFEILPSPSIPPVALSIPVTTVEAVADFFQHDISGKFLREPGVTESSDCSRLRISVQLFLTRLTSSSLVRLDSTFQNHLYTIREPVWRSIAQIIQ
jgi:hypothetical protein